MEILHRVELIEVWVARIRRLGSFGHLTVPAYVIDEDGRPVPLAERLEILRSLPDVPTHVIDQVEAHELDVWTWAREHDRAL